MAIKTRDGYRCGYCGKVYPDPTSADTCKASHDLIYLALTQEDINSLIDFLYTKNEKTLTETVVNTLLKHRTLRQRMKK